MARGSTIRPRTRVFWGWEGQSERNYGVYLQLIARDLSVPVHFDLDHNMIGGGDPLAIVEESIKIMLQRERRHGDFDAKAVLLDADRWESGSKRANEAQRLVQRHAVTLIFQHSKHEAMLIRHHDGHQHRKPAADVCERELLKLWPQYKKPCSGQHLYAKFGVHPLSLLRTAEPELADFLQKIGFNT